MDPLYANLDKRNTSADQSKIPTPQPSANSMPDFGRPNILFENLEQPTQSESESKEQNAKTTDESINPIPSTSDMPPTPARSSMSTTPKPIVNHSQDIVLNIEQSKKKGSKKIFVIVAIAVLVCIIVCGICFWAFMSNGTDKTANMDEYVEYFIFGTEGGQNIINDDVFEMNINDFAATQSNDEYMDTLLNKFKNIRTQEGSIESYHRDLLTFYALSSKVLYSDRLDIDTETPSKNSFIKSSYNIMRIYIDNPSENNHLALRKQNQLAYKMLANSLDILYLEIKND